MKVKIYKTTIIFISVAVVILGISFYYLNNENKHYEEEYSLTNSTSVSSSFEEPIMMEPLKNKSILMIGDSITWLDGNEAEGQGIVTGYQDILREQGASIYSYGNPGGTYRLHNQYSNRNHRSIYEEIVEKKYINFYNADVVTLFGGTNDVGVGSRLGKVDSQDPNETFGALNLLIDYLKEKNPNSQIYLFTPIYSSKANRPEKEMKELVTGFEEIANNKDIRFIDMYNEFGINKETAKKYLYDGLHPNNLGMEQIGELFKKVIEKDVLK